MINATDFRNKFDSRDKDRIKDQMSTVIFPTHEEVIRDIDVLKQV